MTKLKLSKYDLDAKILVYIVNVSLKYYICKTFHNRLRKLHIPEQAVCNRAKNLLFPPELKSFNRIERFSLSQYIVLKNIALMLKDHFLNLKGAICNIPIEIANIANTLPQMSRQ